MPGGIFNNQAAIQTLWPTAKSHLTQLQTDLAAVIADLALIEQDRDTFVSYGAGDVSDWVQQFVQRLRVGYQPRVSTSGITPVQIVLVQAANPNVPRDTTAEVQQPISATATGQYCSLT